ncbi:MAG: alpha/beta hydrolase [Pseudomonadota bacterium]
MSVATGHPPAAADSSALAQAFADLGARLPPLAFDSAADRDSADLEGAARYLCHYGLDLAGMPPGVRHAMGALRAGGYRIAAHCWFHPAPRGTAFAVHGYFDHVGLYGHLIRHLLGRSLNVVAFDLPGHGLSGGERVTIASFDHYVEVFEALLEAAAGLTRPWHGVGQSTGGAIVLHHLLRAAIHPFAGVALLAPLVHPRGWAVNRLIYLATHRWRTRIARKFMANSGDSRFLDFVARRDPLQARHVPLEWIGAMKRWAEELRTLPPSNRPASVIQGDADTTLDWRYNLRLLRRKLPNARFHLLPGARHHLVNEIEPIRARVFAALGF